MHGPSLPSDGFLGRLKSHEVIEWTLAYAALAYTVLHGAEMLSEAQSWPHAIVRVLSLRLILGVPIIALLYAAAAFRETSAMSAFDSSGTLRPAAIRYRNLRNFSFRS